MNEIQIIQNQLRSERLHFTQIAQLCQQALEQGHFTTGSDFARACADYFAFAATRVRMSVASPEAGAAAEQWREFLSAFNVAANQHFAPLEQQDVQNLPVTEWRARFPVDADSIVLERRRYERVRATVP